MNTDMVSSQGTAIGEAIELATTYYNDADQPNKLLFILSEGEDHVGGFADITDKAAENGIKIFTKAAQFQSKEMEGFCVI